MNNTNPVTHITEKLDHEIVSKYLSSGWILLNTAPTPNGYIRYSLGWTKDTAPTYPDDLPFL